MIEIYALCDPDIEEIRYVGKAKDAHERLQRHISESRTGRRPVHGWIRSVLAGGVLPIVKVLETVEDGKWEEAEKRLIAEHRKSGRLLNLADGGAMPSQTIEQRQAAARASNKKQAERPEILELNKIKRDLSKLHSRFMREGDFFQAYKMRFHMKLWAWEKPQYYGCWADL